MLKEWVLLVACKVQNLKLKIIINCFLRKINLNQVIHQHKVLINNKSINNQPVYHKPVNKTNKLVVEFHIHLLNKQALIIQITSIYFQMLDKIMVYLSNRITMIIAIYLSNKINKKRRKRYLEMIHIIYIQWKTSTHIHNHHNHLDKAKM